jgi:hypothetical protein
MRLQLLRLFLAFAAFAWGINKLNRLGIGSVAGGVPEDWDGSRDAFGTAVGTAQPPINLVFMRLGTVGRLKPPEGHPREMG